MISDEIYRSKRKEEEKVNRSRSMITSPWDSSFIAASSFHATFYVK